MFQHPVLKKESQKREATGLGHTMELWQQPISSSSFAGPRTHVLCSAAVCRVAITFIKTFSCRNFQQKPKVSISNPTNPLHPVLDIFSHFVVLKKWTDSQSLVRHVRSLEVTTPSQQQAKSWTNWKSKQLFWDQWEKWREIKPVHPKGD